MRLRFRSTTAVVAAIIAVTACGASTEDAVTEPAGTVGGVGVLPEALQLPPADAVPVGTIVPRDTVVRVEDGSVVADRVAGTRVLVIGDSIFASMSARYGGELCATLNLMGWDVAVDAEVGRFVDFVPRVLDRRLGSGADSQWDAVVITVGSNYRGDLDAYRSRLVQVLDRLEPRPVILVTIAEFRPDRAEVNEVMAETLQFYSEVRLVDWASMVREEPGLLAGDGLHLSDAGRARLAAEIGAELGTVGGGDGEGDGDGACLPTSFRDDSAADDSGSFVAPAPAANPRSTPSPSPRPRPTTTTTTTTARTTGGGTSTGGSGTGTGGGAQPVEPGAGGSGDVSGPDETTPAVTVPTTTAATPAPAPVTTAAPTPTPTTPAPATTVAPADAPAAPDEPSED